MNFWDRVCNLFLAQCPRFPAERDWGSAIKRLAKVDRDHLSLLINRLTAFCRDHELPVAILLFGSVTDRCHKDWRNPNSYADIDLRLLPIRPWDLRRAKEPLLGFITNQREIGRDDDCEIWSERCYWTYPGYEWSSIYQWEFDAGVPIQFFWPWSCRYDALTTYLQRQEHRDLKRPFAIKIIDPLGQLPKRFRRRGRFSYSKLFYNYGSPPAPHLGSTGL